MDSAACSSSFSRSPTPSRRNRRIALSALLAVVLALFAAAAPASGSAEIAADAVRAGEEASAAAAGSAPAPARPARADSASRRARPFMVMMRSAVVPGWGQLYNHKVLKAGIVIAGEGLLAYQAVKEYRRETDSVDRLNELLDQDLGPGDPAYDAEDLNREEHRNRKVNWIWWGLAAHLLSMMDAYVDAHLASFDADFGSSSSELAPGEKPRLTLAIRTRF